jgi:ketosteroid isomerase-like protein
VSQENVEVVRQVHAAFGRGDLEAFLSCWQPDAKYRAAITQTVEGEAGDFHGHNGLRRWWRDLHDLYDDLHTNLLEMRELGDRVLVVFEIEGRGRGSGMTRIETLAQVVSLRNASSRRSATS